MRKNAIEHQSAMTEHERCNQTESEKQSLNNQCQSLTAQLSEARSNNARLNERLEHYDYEVKRLTTQIDTIQRQHTEALKQATSQQEELMQRYEAKFRVLANEIMTRQAADMRQQNEQHLGEILTPLKENIEQFRHDVNQCYSNEARERFSLQEKIKDLIETNNNIGREAKELAQALRGNSKTQGDWGELVLENILENSGLRRDEEFMVQQTTDESGQVIRDEAGRGLRPDVVVHYPGGKAMVIDSKVSLTAFVDYVNAEDPVQKEQFGRQHLNSVIKHINELSEKKYNEYIGLERLDFVMMFIPNEGAYAAAMTIDPTLWQKAYDKHVLVVSPTQLVGSLRLIKQLWDHDRQTRNAIEIAKKSGQMYDKFVGFVDDMEKIAKGIKSTQTAYDEAMKKLKYGTGNIISRAETLRTLGIKATKRLPSATEDDEA